MKNRFFIFLALVLLSFSDSYSQENKDILDISLIDLISNKDKYHNKKISLKGFFNYSKEGTSVYISRESFINEIYKNGVYIYISKKQLEKNNIEPSYKGYLRISGTYSRDDMGHMGLFNGSLKFITDIDKN